ncbi:DUF4347 domain-containing protein [Rubripirellula reticaptiva]|uniref:CotH protein n=1 Tax=Rubripirellula reticaptiva TaxID=2528013 RepID=A0A5C6EUK4_9BACT|nr:DUF4347 domain-containing protein [Rubripirellula reticaptiva]TWU51777.1 CotH protein [Rubripirellula reticaptiva]
MIRHSKTRKTVSCRQNHRSSGGNRWSISSLEKRVMLAADCGVVLSAAASSANPVAAEVGRASPVQADACSNIVFIDSGVESIGHLLDGIHQDHELVLLDPNRDGLSQISQTLAGRTNVGSIHIVAHGQSGQLQLGNQLVDTETVQTNQRQIKGWSRSLTADADILIYGCETGAGTQGLQFIKALAKLTGADVAASTDKTGASSQGADWDLEQHVGNIEAGLAFNVLTRQSYEAVLPITIRAAGTTGEEQMLLQIDEVTVATYNNLSTNFQQYLFDADGVNADQVRIVFTNDFYDPANGIDRNLRVDKINIDGVDYQTEAPEVFSTGTWLSVDGIAPGNRLSDTLHTNGYFQYAGSTVDPGGDPSLLVINEIHYNPGPDGVVDGDAEFLELYNSGDQTVDLGGMSFTGFDLTFAPGTTIGAGQYAIVAPSIALAQSTWGVTPIAEFAGGGLSGGGELLQLIAADGVTVIDEVDYTDDPPWTSQPDGNGPSLELSDWALDNSVATNWQASIGAPTPAAANSVFGVQPVDPITDIVVTPSVVLPNQDFSITATIEGATSANLIYKVMFGGEQSVAMTSTGGDNWTATLPGADAGTLVRYRIESDVAFAPFADSINYFGVVVSPTDVVGNELPLFQFFVDEAEFTELTTTDLALTNTKIEAVVYYNGEVIDNATVRVRGGDYSREFYPKKSLKFELPKGYDIDIGTNGVSYLVDEWGIQADFGDWSLVTPDINWDIFNAETNSITNSFFVRAEVNGDFHGVFRFQELYDGAWRDVNGISDSDEFYKAEEGAFGSYPKFDKKSPDDGDYTSIELLNDVLIQPPSDAKTAFLYDKVDIPNVVNHMALSTLMRHDDQRVQNFYMLLDDETGRWSVVEWDLDRLWVVPDDGDGGNFTTPEPINAELLNAVFEVPEFQDMYWRRMQTLVDTYLDDTTNLTNRFEELRLEIGATNSTLELAKWGRSDFFANPFWAQQFQEALDARKTAFTNEIRMPGSASGVNDIVINELHYNPLDGDAEFLELYNASATESVDLSGWTIDAVGLKIEFGTVILPGQHIVFTDNFSRFTTQHGGNPFVAQQYDGGLSGGGELVELVDLSGNVVDAVDYDDAAPWVTEPDGNGFSLSLIDPALDNNVATNWVASSQINGTPGLANDSSQQTTSVKIFAAGTSGNEILTLEVAGSQVATFKLSDFGGQAGDLSDQNYVELNWATNSLVDPGDIRINFINDRYEPAAGIDWNVAIDRIEVSGVAYQTEAPDVYSTGTYLAADGIVPGYRQSEILHTNGYFQYASIAAVNQLPTSIADLPDVAEGNSVSGNLLNDESESG